MDWELARNTESMEKIIKDFSKLYMNVKIMQQLLSHLEKLEEKKKRDIFHHLLDE